MIEAVSDLVIVAVEIEDTKAGGLIFIPETQDVKARISSYYGRVIAVGPDYPYREVKPGALIVFRRHEGKAIRIDALTTYRALKARWVDGLVME